MTALQPRTREAVLTIAEWQVGVLESPAGSNKVKYNTEFYGREVSRRAYPWCMAFIWRAFREVGFNLYKTAGCSAFVRRYKAFSPGQVVTRGYRPGDIVLTFPAAGRRRSMWGLWPLSAAEPSSPSKEIPASAATPTAGPSCAERGRSG